MRRKLIFYRDFAPLLLVPMSLLNISPSVDSSPVVPVDSGAPAKPRGRSRGKKMKSATQVEEQPRAVIISVMLTLIGSGS